MSNNSWRYWYWGDCLGSLCYVVTTLCHCLQQGPSVNHPVTCPLKENKRCCANAHCPAIIHRCHHFHERSTLLKTPSPSPFGCLCCAVLLPWFSQDKQCTDSLKCTLILYYVLNLSVILSLLIIVFILSLLWPLEYEMMNITYRVDNSSWRSGLCRKTCRGLLPRSTIPSTPC